MKKFIGSVLTGLAFALAFASPAAAASVITPGAFCAKAELGTHKQSDTGKWYVCAYDVGSTKYKRWHPDFAYVPPVSPAPSPTVTTPAAPAPTSTDLPVTGPGGSTGPLALAGLGLVGIAGGAGLLAAARRRETR